MTREKLMEMVNEIEIYGGYSADEIAFITNAIEGYLQRCVNRYKYYDYFTIATGKKYGDAIEEQIIKSFDGFRKPESDTSFDAWTPKHEKVEIKSLRACSKGQAEIFLREDKVSSSKFSTSSYQQTKPTCCDWFIYHILYGDASRLFVIPSSMISGRPGEMYAEDGKIPLSIQHRNHETEGQVNLGQVLKFAKYFEILDYNLESVYDFSSFQEIVKERLNAVGWKLQE